MLNEKAIVKQTFLSLTSGAPGSVWESCGALVGYSFQLSIWLRRGPSTSKGMTISPPHKCTPPSSPGTFYCSGEWSVGCTGSLLKGADLETSKNQGPVGLKQVRTTWGSRNSCTSTRPSMKSREKTMRTLRPARNQNESLEGDRFPKVTS